MDFSETRELWNRLADDWDTQVGDDGDINRILNSDPVLWRFAGDVAGLRVLDAGCGTGYLSRKLQEQGAQVTGVDLSERMIEIASAKCREIKYRVDSCSKLATVADQSMDLVIANYVLMDTPDLEGTLETFCRVLRAGGTAIVIFSHPCFPQGRATISAGGDIAYHWTDSYFERSKYVDPPWGHFTADFIWFHRPLSDYWKAFRCAGFAVVDFDEPRVTEERYHLAHDLRKLESCKSRPYSVAFKLVKETR